MQPQLARSSASSQGCARALIGCRQQQAAVPRRLMDCSRLLSWQRRIFARLPSPSCHAAALQSASRPGLVIDGGQSHPLSSSSSSSSSGGGSLDQYALLAAPASLLPDVKAFYKRQGQRGVGPKPGENLYVLVAEGTEDIAAAVCVGAPRTGSTGSGSGSFRFLRALCVARHLRRLGIGRRLAAAVPDLHDGCSIYCFAFLELAHLYRQAGYEEVPTGDAPCWMEKQFTKVSRKQEQYGRPLTLMVHQCESRSNAGAARASPSASVAGDFVTVSLKGAPSDDARTASSSSSESRLSLVLLQHANELRRPTATGPLLSDPLVAPHLAVEKWTWAGRVDNANVAARLEALPGRTVLVWSDNHQPNWDPSTAARPPDANAGIISDAEPSEKYQETQEGTTYVILDGTWQEARAIYRKGPDRLRQMPRVALAASGKPSEYALRSDRGWKSRFGGSGSGASHLMCTAEAAAALVEQKARNPEGGRRIRESLDRFQREYAEKHQHVKARMVE